MSEISSPKCDKCGFYHPLLADGRCPIKEPLPEDQVHNDPKIQTSIAAQSNRVPMHNTKEEGGIDFEPLFKPLGDIVISQVENKGIKDIKKLFQFIIIKLVKSIDNYKEE
jgi:hypothetical protein